MRQTFEGALGRGTIALRLHQDVRHDPVLIHRAPKAVDDAVDADEDLIHMPGVAGSWASAAQPRGEFRTELSAPMADTLPGDHDTLFGQDQLKVAQAEVEQVIQPDNVADDLPRKTMAAIQGWPSGHASILARRSTSGQLIANLPMPWHMIQHRAADLGFKVEIGYYTLRATGITAHLEAGGTLENAQAMAAHESSRITKLYDRTNDAITLDEVERISI